VPERKQKQKPAGGVVNYIQATYSFESNYNTHDIFALDQGTYWCNNPLRETYFTSGPYIGQCNYDTFGSGTGGSGAPLDCPDCDLSSQQPFLDNRGQPRKGLLNGCGGKLPPQYPPIYLQIQAYPVVDFTPLGLPASFSDVQ
jgi:hypothetical protein